MGTHGKVKKGGYKLNEDKKTMCLYISIVVLVLVCGYLLCSLYHYNNASGTAQSIDRDISGAQQSQQSAINRLDGITTDLGTTASEVGRLSSEVGDRAVEIGGTAGRIRTDQERLTKSASLIAEGQGILRDIQKSNQQENQPTKD